MNSFFRPQTLLEDRQYNALSLRESKGLSISHWRRGRLFFRKPLVIALTVILLGFSAKVFAEPIKLGYTALSGAQVASCMATEGGYLSNHGIQADPIYTPAAAAAQP